MSKIVPFGKYKGQPVEVLIADRPYFGWCQAQPGWVAFLRTVFDAGAASELADTPEHNALQRRFLDIAFRQAVVLTAVPDFVTAHGYDVAKSLRRQIINAQERCAKDIETRMGYGSAFLSSPEINGKIDACKTLMDGLSLIVLKADQFNCTVDNPEFEAEGWDVIHNATAWAHINIINPNKVSLPESWHDNHGWHGGTKMILIECKPSLGDDYPAVLRQIKQRRFAEDRRRVQILLVDHFGASGANLNEVRQIFETSEIVLILLRDVLAKEVSYAPQIRFEPGDDLGEHPAPQA